MADICYPSCEQPQTRRGQERRLALLLCATDLFLEKGYDAVSLDDIVNHAGGSKTSIYKYFGNKEGLFTAICDYRREVFFKGVCFPYTPEKNNLRIYLIQTLQRFYQHIVQPENIAFMRMFTEQSRNLMGLNVQADDAEIFDYINYCVDIFLKAHQKV